MLYYLFKSVHMFQPGTLIATNDVARYLPEVSLPIQKSINSQANSHLTGSK